MTYLAVTAVAWNRQQTGAVDEQEQLGRGTGGEGRGGGGRGWYVVQVSVRDKGTGKIYRGKNHLEKVKRKEKLQKTRSSQKNEKGYKKQETKSPPSKND